MRQIETSEDRLYKVLGERLKQHRDEKRMTQAYLSRLSGVDRSSIANIERGRQRPSVHALYKLCAVLGVEVSTVLPTMAEVTLVRTPQRFEHSNPGVLPSSVSDTIEMLRRELDEQDSGQES